MKKWLFLCLTVLLCGLLVLPAGAAESDALPDGYFATSEDLFQYWASPYPTQYPDYVGGIWTDNGTSYPLTIALTDDAAGKAGQREILRLIADDNSVKFTTVKYSRNLLEQAMEAITPYFEQDVGLVSLGLMEMENCIEIGIHADYENNEATHEFLRTINQSYGKMFRVYYTDGYVTYTLELTPAEGIVEDVSDLFVNTAEVRLRERRIRFTVMAVICVFSTVALITLLRRRRGFAAQTSDGTVTVATDGKMTLRDTEQAIRKSEVKPPEDLEDKIISKLNK